jgi:DNA-binding transcriptional MerR regulator
MKIKKCEICNKEFKVTCGSKFCSLECKKIADNKRYKNSNLARHKLYNGIEGEDYIICKICNMKVKRVYGQHLKFIHKTTTSEYKKEFPGAPIMTSKDKETSIKNRCKHMKEEKYRKMSSERWKGEKNVNSKSKTTEKTRKERSPFSKEFYDKKNIPQEQRAIFIKDALKNREFDTRLEYYTKRGFSLEEAKKMLKDRQTTFSLEKCIKKYGEIEGTKKWKERQEKWKRKVFNKNTHISKGISKLSEEIISKILFYNVNKDVLLYDKNEKFIYDKDKHCVYKYDLTNKTNKRIIEVNGIFWHCKEGIYKEDYFHKIKNKTAKEIREMDAIKYDLAKTFGYKILIIWEDDYKNNPEETIKKCVSFIYEKTN